MQGDIACAEGALAAGCKFFGGYPITPASEIAERMAERLPQVGGVYIQMEDELASIAAVVGSSWTGAKSMTATSGPGISLMQENIGYAVATETPCVLINVQRGGPSTGIPSIHLQGDIIQARRGSHGEYKIIALAPASAQEMFDFTIDAFNLAEKYRTAVFVLADAFVGHTREEVIIPEPEEIYRVQRKLPEAGSSEGKIRGFLDEDIAPMPIFGHGFKTHVTGSCHNDFGQRNVIDAEALDYYIKRLNNKISKRAHEIISVSQDMDGKEVALISYGSCYRAAREALNILEDEGMRQVGSFRLITVWPFPRVQIQELARKVKSIIVLENNLGQITPYVEAAAGGQAEVIFLPPRVLGTLHDPHAIVDKVKEVIP
ncbi:2-oxoacid:acceptor oxidoreductase subunit alpha [Candidatus Aerophobetes bacterium]|uniref:2-oxoacid:acceptor oxidoreductase subunit alpha n=1 Tax=Aerophobetes bacterium TaxID=2030807 RepID=A0A523TGM6_UNCAE|nr:MAG: 2-oxoacid:acceptor oxidoreductase subunit alpha [Candidatus Aerophobetes bacterium]